MQQNEDNKCFKVECENKNYYPLKCFFNYFQMFNTVLSWCTLYVKAIGNIGLFHGLESDIVVTQFPLHDSQKGLDKPVWSDVE